MSTIHSEIMLHTLSTMKNRLKPWCGDVHWALCSTRYAMPVCDAIANCCGRCYHNSERSLLIVSMLVLRLKAAESFLETSQCTWEHNTVEVQKNSDYEMWKERLYAVLAKIRINWGLLKLQNCTEKMNNCLCRSYIALLVGYKCVF